ncbi:MAG TPA: carboxypeptidase-like regulatory domain-containing protein, partial [Vicinamibacterales bacterium]
MKNAIATRSPITFLVTLLATGAMAQGTGRISGVVRDPAGAVITGAQVEVSCGATRDTLTTSDRGEFSKTGLPDGSCRITARSDAFEPESIVAGTSGRPVTLVLRIRPFAQEVVVTPARGAAER